MQSLTGSPRENARSTSLPQRGLETFAPLEKLVDWYHYSSSQTLQFTCPVRKYIGSKYCVVVTMTRLECDAV
jgi:hypothetical protein